MRYRPFGNTGIRVSEIGFGAWAIGGSWGIQNETDSLEALETALDRGVNLIDTAAGYGDGKSEKLIGRVLKTRTDTPYICTKTPPLPGKWPPSPYCRIEERYPEKYLRENVEQRRTNLQADRIDILLLHTWTRAWNDRPLALETLQKLKSEGKVRWIGISTPEHDQNCAIQLMREGYIDAVQVIFNIFEQEPAAQLLPVAGDTGTGVIVRVALDEGVLTGKYKGDEEFPEKDFRRNYFAGDRLQRAAERTRRIMRDTTESGYSMPQLALKFALSPDAVSTVIPGIRNREQAIENTGVSGLPDLSGSLLVKMREHAWNRAFWYGGK